MQNMNKVQAYILHKESEKFSSCDDNFNFDTKKLNFAVCDGSSSDFFSKIYSRVLSDKYSEIGGEMFSSSIISELNNQWREMVKEEIEGAGCRPGSFPFVHYQRRDPGCSTFVCLSFHSDDTNPTFDFYALGDSMVFFIPKGEYIPKLQISSDSNDDYSFNPDVHFGYTPPIASSYSTKWLDLMKKEIGNKLTEGSFVMVTDAIAEWLLRNDGMSKEDKFKEILSVDSQEKFTSYVREIRDNGAHMDDMTLLKIYIDDINELKFSQDNIDSFDYRAIALEQSHNEKTHTTENPLPKIDDVVSTGNVFTVSDEDCKDESIDCEETASLKKKVEDLQKKVEDLQKKNEELQKRNEELQKDQKKKNCKNLQQKKDLNAKRQKNRKC